jgi:K+-sensing histidine kinase KdpD
VLHEFLASNRAILIDRCHAMVAARSETAENYGLSVVGIPIFLDQLIKTLANEGFSTTNRELSADDAQIRFDAEIGETARQHGRRLLDEGCTLESVVRDYGDVCQAVTNLALEKDTPIAVGEYRTFNRCLDNAIAGAVTEYARQGAESQSGVTNTFNSRFGPVAHELRNHLHTVTLVVAAIKVGKVPMSGATSGVLDRSLFAMRGIIDHALAEIRVTARMPPRKEVISLAKFLEDAKVTASFDAQARRATLEMDPVAPDLFVCADPEMLAASVANLLQNAFKFTKPHQPVRLHAYGTNDRVRIDVEDGCGGLGTGMADKMFALFIQGNADRSGLGLGLDISRRGVEANGGVLSVRDLPGTGCIFTIDMPRFNAK